MSALLGSGETEGAGVTSDAKTQPSINQFFGKQKQPSSPGAREQAASIRCPICNKSFTSTHSNEKINAHVDLCLNKELVPGWAADEKSSGNKKLKRSVTDYFKR